VQLLQENLAAEKEATGVAMTKLKADLEAGFQAEKDVLQVGVPLATCSSLRLNSTCSSIDEEAVPRLVMI
jgi:hypothetical protein